MKLGVAFSRKFFHLLQSIISAAIVFYMASNNNSERKGFTITWIVENFQYSTLKYGDFLRSPTFIVDTMEKTKWRLVAFPRYYDIEDGFSVGLERMSDCKGPPSIKIDSDCALLTADGSVAEEYNVREQEVSKNHKVHLKYFNLNNGSPETFLPNGKLIIRCKMWKFSGEINNDGYCMARTHIGVEKKSSIWSIRNFSTLKKGKELTYRINSTHNDKSIATLKFSVSEEDERLQVRFITSDTGVETRIFSIKLSILDINGEAVTCGESEPVFRHFLKGPEYSFTLAKKDIMRKKSQCFPDDVLSLLYQCYFSTRLVYEEIENTNYGWIPPQTANACLPDLKQAGNTATANTSAPSVLKRNIELMLQENVLCDSWKVNVQHGWQVLSQYTKNGMYK
ncbi:speckle-type POZ protein [Caerostris darwini]|uniref:Speckle-type POZ protein n=1 Tax=Caerostris darwini TaxID=1538125 RepID=A0AAV4VSM4_9ARAC|nr:speckle-type POZ protein [Caerostris darwini]